MKYEYNLPGPKQPFSSKRDRSDKFQEEVQIPMKPGSRAVFQTQPDSAPSHPR